MAKRTLSEHLHELRYHMIAGAFWYGMGFVTLAGIVNTFVFLRSHLGIATSIIIDILAAILIYAIAVWWVRTWKATQVIQHPPKKLRKVQVYREGKITDTSSYRLKVRIAITNEIGRAIDIRKVVWIANGGEVGLALPPKMKLQIEKFKGAYRTNQWIDDEFYDLHVPADFTFRTWIGLHNELNDRDFGRFQENEQFGTLSLTIEGYDGDLQIPV